MWKQLSEVRIGKLRNSIGTWKHITYLPISRPRISLVETQPYKRGRFAKYHSVKTVKSRCASRELAWLPHQHPERVVITLLAYPMTLRYVQLRMRATIALPFRGDSPASSVSTSARAYTHTASCSHAASTGI